MGYAWIDEFNRKIVLRPATPEDFDMALKVYLVTMMPLTAGLMAWDEVKQSTSFAAQWNVEEAQIIVFEGHTVVWMQLFFL